METTHSQLHARNEVGASATEYGLLAVAIAAVLVVVLMALGGLVRDLFGGSCQVLDTETSTASADCTP